MTQQHSQDPREAAKPVFDAAMGKIIQAFNLTSNRELGWTFDAQHKSRVMDCMTELIALFEGGDISVISASLWWKWVASGIAPAPIRVGRTTMWRRSEVVAMMERLAEKGAA